MEKETDNLNPVDREIYGEEFERHEGGPDAPEAVSDRTGPESPDGPGALDAMVSHLAELRSRLIKCGLAFLAAFAVTAYHSDSIMGYAGARVGGILGGEKLVFLSPAEGFFVSLKVAMFAAVLLVLPYMLYQFWRFVYVALEGAEKGFFNAVLVTSAASFYAGLLFSVYAAIPVGMGFLIGYSSGMFRPMISVSAYYDFLIYTSLTFGIIFELPVALLFANLMGFVKSEWLARNRKYAVLVIFIVGGIFSPPDVFSQFLVSVPMLVLYEFGIVLIRLIGRK